MENPWIYNKLKLHWSHEDSILKQVAEYFTPEYPEEANQAFSDAMDFIEGMESEELESPAEYWDEYCLKYSTEEPNPFI